MKNRTKHIELTCNVNYLSILCTIEDKLLPIMWTVADEDERIAAGLRNSVATSHESTQIFSSPDA